MSEAQDFLNDIFSAYAHSYSRKDDAMLGIMAEKLKFEKLLDDMWDNYRRGNMKQVVAYRKQVEYIKNAGLVVLRSKSTGKHLIKIPTT